MKIILAACLACAIMWVACEGEDAGMPEVMITSPVDGAEVNGTVEIMADATDDVGIVNVDFYIDSLLVCTDSTEPYGYSWSTAGLADSSVHTIFAMAYDTDTNEATSEEISVTVIVLNTFEASDDFDSYASSVATDTIYALLDGNGNWSSTDWNVMREELALAGNYIMVREFPISPTNQATYHLTAQGNIDTLTVGFTYIQQTNGEIDVYISPNDTDWVDVTSEFGIVTADSATTTSADLTTFVVDFGPDAYIRFEAHATGGSSWFSAIDDFWLSGTVE